MTKDKESKTHKNWELSIILETFHDFKKWKSSCFFQGSSAESLFLPGHGLAQTMWTIGFYFARNLNLWSKCIFQTVWVWSQSRGFGWKCIYDFLWFHMEEERESVKYNLFYVCTVVWQSVSKCDFDMLESRSWSPMTNEVNILSCREGRLI